MKVQDIIRRLERKGYRITRSMKSDLIVVTAPWGASLSFDSYHQAFKFYFR